MLAEPSEVNLRLAGSMIALDFETCLIRAGLQAPPPVCLAVFDGSHKVLHPSAEIESALASYLEGETLWHNSAYDICVALEWYPTLGPLIWRALEEGRIYDTMIVERLAEIGKRTPRKSLALDHLVRAYGLPELNKADGTRLSYGPLLGAPLSAYSPAQVRYALDDAEATWNVYQRQLKRFTDISQADVALLVRKQFWLGLTRARGLRTDPLRLDVLERETLADLDDLRADYTEIGFLRPNETKDMKKIAAYVAQAYDGRPPLTDAGRVSTSRATLEESGDPILERFAVYGETAAVKNKDLPMLRAGAHMPIHTRFGIADTTRSTSSAPNIQNLRRKAGIRECFVPREGYCFVAIDHGGLENATLAQVIVSNLGLWDMATKINAGEDLHCHVAAQILALSYEETKRRYKAGDPGTVNARNCAKVVNFGRPGGMGAPTLKLYAKQSYGMDLTEAACSDLIKKWNAANPDGMRYLEWVKRLPKDNEDRFTLTIPGTTIIRRGATFCAAANSHFQGLGAIVEAECGWAIAKECATGRLRGSFLVNFVHDEFILEVPIGEQTRVAKVLEEVMGTVPAKHLPDVRLSAECVAMDRWSKKAQRLEINGELTVFSC